MSADPMALAAILAMGIVTYLTRIAGVVLLRRLPPTPRFERWCAHVPGAVFSAMCAPMILAAGTAGVIAGVFALVAARSGGGIAGGTIAGVVTIALLRLAGLE